MKEQPPLFRSEVDITKYILIFKSLGEIIINGLFTSDTKKKACRF